MPKQLINIVGIAVTLGIVALGVVVVAIPLWLQSVAVDSQTNTVASTNAIYQSQVDALRIEQERQEEIDASVAALRQELPAVNQFDDVFEVVSEAAASSGVTLSSATAGEVSGFVARTSASQPGEELVDESAGEVAPDVEAEATGTGDGAAESPTPAPSDEATPDAGGQPSEEEAAPSGRQQADFTILATANDMAQATAFIDALRAGPRLLNIITASAIQTGSAVDVQIVAYTYMDSEE